MSHHSQVFFFWKHRCLWVKFSVLVTSHMFCMLHQIPISEYVLTSLWSCQLLIHCWEACYLMPTDLWILHISVIDLKFFKLHLWAEGRSAQATAYLWRSGVNSLLLPWVPRTGLGYTASKQKLSCADPPTCQEDVFIWLVDFGQGLSGKAHAVLEIPSSYLCLSRVPTHPTITNF